MCMIDGCEYNRVATTKMRKARKQHECGECHRTIERGEQYEHTSGIDSEGFAFSYKICVHCRAAAEWLIVNCGGFVMHGVEEDLAEHVEEYNRRDLLRLVVGIRRRWQRKRGAGLRHVPKLPRPIELGDAGGWS